MKILVVGAGGREHALVHALARHGHELLAAPGNPGIAELARLAPVAVDDVDGLAALAEREGVELVVVGPEAPLCAGLADAVRARGIACFGPGAAGARLEGSKVWSKQLFARHGIPTAEFAVCRTLAEVDAALERLGDDVVVKADGLAAGKGVVVCHHRAGARAAAEEMLGGSLGAAGQTVLLERRLEGREVSILALCDGGRVVVLPTAEDHKAVRDGDQGPNTGGMGVVSPAPGVTAELLERVDREVLQPTVRALRDEGVSYRGVLYAGLMVAPDGTPMVLEYNCRFGDPEAEAILLRWEDDPAPWLLGAARGALPEGEPRFGASAAVCVVLAAEGYPGKPRTGDRIVGLAQAGAVPGVVVFVSGARRDGEVLVTAGGRVLAVTAVGDGVDEARARAYFAAGLISWPGVHHRRDIGLRRTT